MSDIKKPLSQPQIPTPAAKPIDTPKAPGPKVAPKGPIPAGPETTFVSKKPPEGMGKLNNPPIAGLSNKSLAKSMPPRTENKPKVPQRPKAAGPKLETKISQKDLKSMFEASLKSLGNTEKFAGLKADLLEHFKNAESGEKKDLLNSVKDELENALKDKPKTGQGHSGATAGSQATLAPAEKIKLADLAQALAENENQPDQQVAAAGDTTAAQEVVEAQEIVQNLLDKIKEDQQKQRDQEQARKEQEEAQEDDTDDDDKKV